MTTLAPPVLKAFVPLERLRVRAFRVPTESPEADGTLDWESTTLVTVEAEAGGETGFGYTYADASAALVIRETLWPVVSGGDAMAPPAAWNRMVRAVRNIGRPGIASGAISAVDNALWDLKARLLALPLFSLLGAVREKVPVYASGGFTNFSGHRLEEHLRELLRCGARSAKIKIGRRPETDVDRAREARRMLGDGVTLRVDANGAYTRTEALGVMNGLADVGVVWFEEPVSSDDLTGLKLLRDRAPGGLDIAAGEYGDSPGYFRRMLEAGAVGTLQADATRCGGITGFLKVAALCEAFHVPLSAHTSPSQHLHVALAAPALRDVEYFFDHVRIERMFFDGFREALDGAMTPDATRPGNGLSLRPEAARYAVFGE